MYRAPFSFAFAGACGKDRHRHVLKPAEPKTALICLGAESCLCVFLTEEHFMAAKKKSVLAQRVNELEDAVTRMFTGEAPAPKAKKRRKAKRKTAKAAAKGAVKKGKKAAKKPAKKAKKATKKAARKAKRKTKR